MKELFNRFMRLKIDAQNLAGIVQNEGMEVTKEELKSWNNVADKFQMEVGDLVRAVNELYS